MPMFVVKRTLAGITPNGLQGAGIRIKSCAAEMQVEGTNVHWVRSFFLPSVQQTHCYVEGPDEGTIVDLNERAQLPFLEVLEVKEMTPESV